MWMADQGLLDRLEGLRKMLLFLFLCAMLLPFSESWNTASITGGSRVAPEVGRQHLPLCGAPACCPPEKRRARSWRSLGRKWGACSGAGLRLEMQEGHVPRLAKAVDGDSLISWATERGAWVSPVLRVGENGRMIADENVDAGVTLMRIPECLGLNPEMFRKLYPDLFRDIEQQAGRLLSDDEMLTIGLLLLARGTMPGWGGYATWLQGQNKPDLPVFWEEREVLRLGLRAADRVAVMREEMNECISICQFFFAGLEKMVGPEIPAGDTAAAYEQKAVDGDEVKDAWGHVRSRAVLYSSPGQGVERRLYPILDLISHCPSSASPVSSKEIADCQGPCVKVLHSAGETTCESLKPIAAGSEVTSYYGSLSNEDFLVTYGLVPTPYIHRDNRIGFSLPSELFSKSLLALSQQGCSQDMIDRKLQLLQSLGVTTDDTVNLEAVMGEEMHIIRPGKLSVPLSIIARIMCLTSDDELAIMCLSTNGIAKTISPENEGKAMRWQSHLLAQIEGQIFDPVLPEEEKLLDISIGEIIDPGYRRRIHAARSRSGERHVLIHAIQQAENASASVHQSKKPTSPPSKKNRNTKPKGFG